MNYYQYQTVLGLLTICEENDAVIAINVGHYSVSFQNWRID